MPLYTNLKEIRQRLTHYLEPSVGACAGMTLQQLQQTVAGTFHPSDAQLHLLAIRMRLYPEGQNP